MGDQDTNRAKHEAEHDGADVEFSDPGTAGGRVLRTVQVGLRPHQPDGQQDRQHAGPTQQIGRMNLAPADGDQDCGGHEHGDELGPALAVEHVRLPGLQFRVFLRFCPHVRQPDPGLRLNRSTIETPHGEVHVHLRVVI